MAWIVTPALVALRDEFNRRCPNRDKASDGSIGDSAHASSSSDHNPDETGAVPIRDADSTNEVHAIDVDVDLRAADARGPFTMERAVQAIVADHRAGRENRLRYVIFNRRIWSASWGWTQEPYGGANPHDKHAHFSGSYNSGREADTSPWNIGYVEDDMTPAEARAAALGGFFDLLEQAAARNTPTGRQAGDALNKLIVTPLLTAVLQVDEEILAKIAAPDTTAARKAELLRAVLGDEAEAVGRALAGL